MAVQSLNQIVCVSVALIRALQYPDFVIFGLLFKIKLVFPRYRNSCISWRKSLTTSLAVRQRPQQRVLIGIFQIAARRQPARQARDPYRQVEQLWRRYSGRGIPSMLGLVARMISLLPRAYAFY